jgi:carbon monoxide dehydrogenase subunit G
MIRFETDIRIDRPAEEVFDVVSDPLRFPVWNSAVKAMRLVSGQAREPGSIYSMERELPSGKAENDLEVTARRRPTEFGVRTISGPTPFAYTYRFAAEGSATLVTVDARVELDGVAGLLGPLAGRAIRRGVDANLGELKRSLESGNPRER